MARQRGGSIEKHGTENADERESRALIDDLRAVGLDMEKCWSVVDGDCCEICRLNAAEGWIDSEQAHASGHMYPLAHTGCRCCELYRRKGSA
jgi:hypothetical protein